MPQKKIDIIQEAYSLLRISGLTVNPTPADVSLALRRLESMAAELAGRNITCGYRLDLEPNENQETGLEQRFQHMFSSNLAIRMLSDFGLGAPPSLVSQATQSLSSVSSMIAADTIRQVMPGRRVPIGEANSLRRRTYQRFYRIPQRAPDDANLHHMYIGDINDYTENFSDYLKDGEFIVEVVHLANDGIDIMEMDYTGPVVNYRVGALSNVQVGPWQRLRIRIKTNLGRVTTRIINFEIALPVTMEDLEVI